MKEIVYILTNPSLNGWIKIGKTTREDVEERVLELSNSTAIPLDFRVYAILYCDDCTKTEQVIHNIFDNINPELHAIEDRNGKIRRKEFFQIDPEKAYDVLESLVVLSPDKLRLERYNMTREQKEIENIVDSVSKKNIREKANFKILDIPVGSELTFINNDNIKCTVVDDYNTVEYQNEKYTISALAKKLIDEAGYNWSANGFQTFRYKGEVLRKRRLRMEKEAEGQSL